MASTNREGEASYHGSLHDAAHSSEGASADVVLRQLTTNAQKAFLLLVQHQLDEPNSAGLSFPDFYLRCRDKFIATAEMSLRRHINEFEDHKLVRTRKGVGGTQCYYCTLSTEQQRQLVAANT